MSGASIAMTLRRQGSGPRAHAKTTDSGKSDAQIPGSIVYSHCSTRGLRLSMEDSGFTVGTVAARGVHRTAEIVPGRIGNAKCALVGRLTKAEAEQTTAFAAAHTHLQSHPRHTRCRVCCEVDVLGLPGSGFFGVFDGHGGADVARYIAEALPTRIFKMVGPLQKPRPAPQRGGARPRKTVSLPPLAARGGVISSRVSTRTGSTRRRINTKTASPASSAASTSVPAPMLSDAASVSSWPPMLETPLNDRVQTALRNSFTEVDAQCREVVNAEACGTTACCVLLLKDHYAFSNLGDSRAILVSGGNVVFSTTDHKPTDRRERSRIYGAGGFVLRNRIRGILAVARAFGDFAFKGAEHLGPSEQEVTSTPDVVFVDRQPHRDEFIVVACDGLWDVMSNVAVADFVAAELAHNGTAETAASALIDIALARGSTDNITAIVIQFVDGSVRQRPALVLPTTLPPISAEIEHRRELRRHSGSQSPNRLSGSDRPGHLNAEAVSVLESLSSLDRVLASELDDDTAC